MTTTTDTLTDQAWELDAPGFEHPYVDADEWRSEPVAHRYVHGGFAGTDTRFSFYFPPVDGYEGRFVQHVTPVPQSENLAASATGEEDKITFALAGGGYFVETNGGGPDAANPFSGMDPTIGAYRANAAAAQFSRRLATALYGEHRTYGYLYGGSGGGFRTIGAAENTVGVWDGFVPYVIGSPMAMPNVFSVRMHAQRVLREVLDDIADAYDVGGDPSALVLTDEQRAAFDEVTRMGFPPRSWFGWRTMGMHGFSALYPGVLAADPTYGDDFWSVPGYLGADPASSVHRDRVVHETTVTTIGGREASVTVELSAGGVDESYQHASGEAAGPVEIELGEAPSGWMLGAELHVRSGAAAGTVLRVASVSGATVTLEPGQAVTVAAGDTVVLDNSTFLAAQTYHRHQVPGSAYPVWDQFRDDAGEPAHPQRPVILGPLFTAGASGSVPTGEISGKMIVVACLLDREAFAWQADWYRQRVQEHLGADADADFRLWYMDDATHGDDETQENQTHTVPYVGVLHTALRQLADWVERGLEPAPSTSYTIDDGQVSVPATAASRGGVQPVVTISAGGSSSARVAVGEEVRVTIEADSPEHGLPFVSVATDLTGAGRLDEPIAVARTHRLSLTRTCTFERPGTYFIAARATTQDDLDAGTAAGRAHGIARARIVVS
ncbi:hypothetical protein ACFVU2_18210 [Leifsonia sp. NPDC058194]|uniref:hypothetical protein n=1 Tax=Leifsonia sp. NPDC058194 TaxID=3346374 RepID=UPI0036DB7340